MGKQPPWWDELSQATADLHCCDVGIDSTGLGETMDDGTPIVTLQLSQPRNERRNPVHSRQREHVEAQLAFLAPNVRFAVKWLDLID